MLSEVVFLSWQLRHRMALWKYSTLVRDQIGILVRALLSHGVHNLHSERIEPQRTTIQVHGNAILDAKWRMDGRCLVSLNSMPCNCI